MKYKYMKGRFLDNDFGKYVVLQPKMVTGEKNTEVTIDINYGIQEEHTEVPL